MKLSALFLVFSVFCSSFYRGASGQDILIITNANVYTMSSTQKAEGFVVQSGKIVDVDRSEVLLERWSGDNAKVIDMKNRTIIPGLIDAHVHLMRLGIQRAQANLRGTRSVEEVRARLREYISRSNQTFGDNLWVRGNGWDQTEWPGGQFPTAADLDADPMLAAVPIMLLRIDNHAQWVNTRVLKMMEAKYINLTDIKVEGGEVIKSPGLGVFTDQAMSLLAPLVPPVSEAEKFDALDIALKEIHSFGITGVHDAGVVPDDLAFYKKAVDAGKFQIRNYAMVSCPNRNDYCGDRLNITAFEHGFLIMRSVKLYVDGALGSWGAAMIQPYTDDPSKPGNLLISERNFTEQVAKWMERGLQVNAHCIGDLANHIAVNGFEENLRNRTQGELTAERRLNDKYRLRIEHAQILTQEDIQRVGKLGIIPSMQPTHATSDMNFAETRVGPDRIKGAYAWRSFLNVSVPALPLGSDFPVESANPLLGFYAAVTRLTVNGTSPQGDNGWYPEQKLTRAEALKGFTRDAAYASFQEEKVGSIEPEKVADFVVLSQDIMEVPREEILNTKVLATVLNGTVVYGNLTL
ncbi:uncharacterized protein VTP21DRAFT_10728 [Calcarisporiella thermophila]|uniref:uncharacterized protein n=1 Tax=Calcarisporiella thermophila TaxID=911321 RepID=UPI0037445CE4